MGREPASSPAAERGEGISHVCLLGGREGDTQEGCARTPPATASSNPASQSAFQTGGRVSTCTNHTISCESMSLYLLGSWGTEHWQKGTLWLSPRFSFSLCFLIAAEPCEKRVHRRALRNYLYCPHTRFVHLSDPSALKNCQLCKEEGINTFRKIWDRRGRERGREREKEGQTLGNRQPCGSRVHTVSGKHEKHVMGLRKGMWRRKDDRGCPFQFHSPGTQVW